MKFNISIEDNSDDCQQRIYEKCSHRSQFTEQEMESVRQYLIKRFTEDADVKPIRAPCQKLYVRKDFKCLTDLERHKFLNVLKKIYSEGLIGELTEIHRKNWNRVHQYSDFQPFHRHIINVLEQRIMEIEPGMTVPYWVNKLFFGHQNFNFFFKKYSIDFASPEKSILFKYLGTSGTKYTNWCLTDGIYSDMNLTRCVKRDWINEALSPLDTPEFDTISIQNSKDFTDLGIFTALGHFITHLSIGGDNGELSLKTAPYE